jgi:hypothetical protein
VTGPGQFLGKPGTVKYGSELHAQRANYIALRKSGWVIRPSTIGLHYFTAIKEERQESVSAKDFRELFQLANAKDRAWRDKERQRARLAAEKAAKE